MKRVSIKLVPGLLKVEVCMRIAFGSFSDLIFAENNVSKYWITREMKETAVPYALGEDL